MKKTILKISCVLLSTVVSAISASPVFSAAADSQEVQRAITDYQDSFSSATVYSAGGSSDNSSFVNIEGYDIDQMCCYDQFRFNAEQYTDTGTFSSLIEEDNKYYLPYENQNGVGMIQLREDENNELYVMGYTIAETHIPNDVLDIEAVTAAVTEVFSAETAKEIRYLENTMYNLRLAYFIDNGIEYVIPFTVSRVEDVYEGIMDGSIYTAADFADWMLNSFEAAPSTNENGELLFGGLPFVYVGGFSITPYDATSTHVPLFWLYPAVSAVLLAGAGIAFFKMKKAKE